MADLIGSNGNDVLYGSDYNDAIYGQAGADILLGYDGNDYLNGGSGSDSLWGGVGNDTLTGGAGNTDYFYFTSPNQGFDYITDFTSSISLKDVEDKIYISSEGFGIGIGQYEDFRFDFNSHVLYFGDTPLLRTNPAGLLDTVISTTAFTGDIVIY